MSDFNKRITGEVAAPDVSVCRIADGWTDPRSVGEVAAPCDHSHLDHTRPGNFCVACGKEQPDRSASAERAAVVKHLRKMARGSQVPTFSAAWATAADHIEKGEHIP